MEKKNKNRTEIINPEITLGSYQECQKCERPGHDPIECGCAYAGNGVLLHCFIHRLIWDVRKVCEDFHWREWAVDWLMNLDRSSESAKKIQSSIDSIEMADSSEDRIWARSVNLAAINVCRAAYWMAIAVERKQTFALLQAIRFSNSAREQLALAGACLLGVEE